MPYTESTSFTGCPFVITGAGTLGRCIALLMWLTRGETVHLFDTNAVTLEAAQSTSTPNSMASSSASSPAPRTPGPPPGSTRPQRPTLSRRVPQACHKLQREEDINPIPDSDKVELRKALMPAMLLRARLASCHLRLSPRRLSWRR
ncbi:hypothetical protein FIBSPDRAFT_319242 [Athelia psychrophila]|uniref:3-hydroxyacyl-CoA dehydrogenase NAD binding domain-containing protein n=1 Tax=Athelia psychrophila TaxID=1759441 RepID=A0A166QF67_9AGAM|nr:hypothetical protein FIBSPDRAFT_319242 [Fibularhizoctonia sp. CBS 109695]